MIRVLDKLKPDPNTKNVVRIGVLAGMGVGAGNQFYDLLESSIPEELKGSIEIFMINDAVIGQIDEIPDRSSYLLGEWPENPAFELLRRAYQLEQRKVDFIVMPCNTAHFFLPEMKRGLPFGEYDEKTGELTGYSQYKVTTPFIHIQEETLNFIKEEYPNIKKVGVLATTGTVTGGLYGEPIFNRVLEPAGIEVVYPTNNDETHAQDNVMEGIRDVKRADSSDEEVNLKNGKINIMVGVNDLLEQRVEVIIAGCTEVPIVIHQEDAPVPVIDTIAVLVNATIRQANDLLQRNAEVIKQTEELDRLGYRVNKTPGERARDKQTAENPPEKDVIEDPSK